MPNFFIVGAARSGTSSLEEYLNQHPEIYITPKKETHFFAVDHFPASFSGPGDDRLNERVIRDEDQYAQLFTNVKGKKAIGEASAFISAFHMRQSGSRKRFPMRKLSLSCESQWRGPTVPICFYYAIVGRPWDLPRV